MFDAVLRYKNNSLRLGMLCQRAVFLALSLLLFVAVITCGREPVFYEDLGEFDGSSFHEQLKKLARSYQEHLMMADAMLKSLTEANRNLQRALVGGLDKGCYLAESLADLKITIAGERLPDAFRARERLRHKHITTGDPHTFSISLSPDISFVLDAALLLQSGEAIISDFAHLQVADVEHITIRKNGVGIKTKAHGTRKGCGLLWLRSCVFTEYYETLRWHVDSVSVSVGEVALYHHGSVAHTFTEASLTWQDTQLTGNAAYQAMTDKDDCRIVDHT